jgi:proteasome lid subunit RPN8/RPN11
MITIEKQALETMIRDARASFPDECCGFFYGSETGNDRLIVQAFPVYNSKEGDKRRRFEIAPLDYMKAEAYAEKNGLILLGIYHSHPGAPAIPSEQDRVAAQPYFSYIILSVYDEKLDHIRSWQLNSLDQFEEETIFQNTFQQQTT